MAIRRRIRRCGRLRTMKEAAFSGRIIQMTADRKGVQQSENTVEMKISASMITTCMFSCILTEKKRRKNMHEELFRLLDRPDTVLVMPTQRMTRHLAVSYAYSRKKAIASDRILSFDTFSSMFEEPHGDRQRASLIVRTVFAASLLEENSDRLSYLFTAWYPQSIPRFTSFIASILPSLGCQNARFTSKELFKDIQLIRSSYSAFLEKHSFYEPSWQKKSVEYFTGERNLSYCLVCPSCEPNMMRLMDTLGEVPFITSYECTEERKASFLLYDNEKAEITALFDQLEMLCDEGVSGSDIALTSPSIARLRPYLELEAEERGIPLSFEKDAALVETVPGRYLKLIGELASTEYEFSALERFLLDDSFPYTPEMKDLNMRLARGMCRASISSDREPRLQSVLKERKAAVHFRTIQSYVRSITGQKDPSKVLSALQGLTSYLFSQDQFRGNEEEKNIYSFLLDAFEKLAAVASSLDRPAGNLYSLFITVISSMDYVSQKRKEGIAVMAWSHDYLMQVPHRFVFAMDDEKCQVEDRDLSFLDDCETDGRKTYSATDALIRTYLASADHIHLSGSRETWDGQAGAPFYFISRNMVVDVKGKRSNRIRPCQVESWLEGRSVKVPDSSKDLTRGLRKKVDFISALSYSAVSSYARCPFAAAMRLFLSLNSQPYSPLDYDVMEAGVFLHSVIQTFLDRHTGLWFERSKMDEYRQEIRNIFFSQLEKSSFSSFVRKRLESDALAGLESFVSLLEENYAPVRVLETEKTVTSGNLSGRIDALFESDGSLMLVDFKTSSVPREQKYQLLMYRKMLCDGGSFQVPFDRLLYYRIADRDGKGHFFPEVPMTRDGKNIDEEKLGKNIHQMDEAIACTSAGYESGDFRTTGDYRNCTHCDFRSICRRRYATV